MYRPVAVFRNIALACAVVAAGCSGALAESPSAFAGTIEAAEIGSRELLYDADRGVGSLLHDNRFMIGSEAHTIQRIRVTPDEFSLCLHRDGEKADPSSALAGRYFVFRKKFSVIGHIAVASLVPKPGRCSFAAPLSVAAGLRRDDFLGPVMLTLSEERPDTVDRYPEESRPFPDPRIAIGDEPLELDVTEYFFDPEGGDLVAEVHVDDESRAVIGTASGHMITFTPVSVGSATATISLYDAAGNAETRDITVTVIPGDGPVSSDPEPPRIIIAVVEPESGPVPSAPVTVDHRQAAREDLEVSFGGAGSCMDLSSAPIRGTAVGAGFPETVYTGVLTGAALSVGDARYGYDASAGEGDLTPATVESGGLIYTITALTYQDADDPIVSLSLVAESGDDPGAGDDLFSDHHLVFKDIHSGPLGSSRARESSRQGSGYRIVAPAPVSWEWFGGDKDVVVEIATGPPGEPTPLPPQAYRVSITGPTGVYRGCSLAVRDPSGSLSNEVPVSTFTITRTREEKEAVRREMQGPSIPEQPPTPKPAWTLFQSEQDIAARNQAAEARRLAVSLTDSSASVSRVQHVPIGRRARVPEVRDLQRLLNLIGYPVAETGAGSPGEETEYFGPATQRAVEAFQRGAGLLVTGDLDRETLAAIAAAADDAERNGAP